MLFNLLYNTIEIGIPSAKAPCEPVPTPLRNLFTVYEHVELSSLTRSEYGFHS